MFGYKRAGDSMVMEFQGGSGFDDCLSYFMSIWNLHDNDVQYDSSFNSRERN